MSAAPMTAAPLSLALDHAGASVGDLDRSIRFYRDVFGFAVDERFAIPGTAVRGAVLVNGGGARVELFHREGSQAAPPGHPIDSTLQQGWFQLAFAVPDVSAAFSRVVDAGATVVKPPFLAPDGRCRVAFVGDPDGHLIELIQRGPSPHGA
jgi:glyoxylase I family protein